MSIVKVLMAHYKTFNFHVLLSYSPTHLSSSHVLPLMACPSCSSLINQPQLYFSFNYMSAMCMVPLGQSLQKRIFVCTPPHRLFLSAVSFTEAFIMSLYFRKLLFIFGPVNKKCCVSQNSHVYILFIKTCFSC